MQFKIFGATDIGRERKYNQDSHFIDSNLGFAVLADGIGGRKGGEVASYMATQGIAQAFIQSEKILHDEIKTFLLGAFDRINSQIISEGQKKPHIQGMGTTAQCLVVAGNQLYIAHIGDSRSYLYYKNNLFQLTIDHNVETFLQNGWMNRDQMTSQAKPGSLTKALGLSTYCEIDIYSLNLQPGEIIISCSDGLYGMVKDKRLLQIIHSHRHQIEQLPAILVDQANKNGGKDNITVVAIAVEA